MFFCTCYANDIHEGGPLGLHQLVDLVASWFRLYSASLTCLTCLGQSPASLTCLGNEYMPIDSGGLVYK